jgi:hypothetical protein
MYRITQSPQSSAPSPLRLGCHLDYRFPHAHGSAETGPYDVVWRLFRMDGLEFGPSLRRGETRTTLIFGGSPYGVDVLAVLHA